MYPQDIEGDMARLRSNNTDSDKPARPVRIEFLPSEEVLDILESLDIKHHKRTDWINQACILKSKFDEAGGSKLTPQEVQDIATAVVKEMIKQGLTNK